MPILAAMEPFLPRGVTPTSPRRVVHTGTATGGKGVATHPIDGALLATDLLRLEPRKASIETAG